MGCAGSGPAGPRGAGRVRGARTAGRAGAPCHAERSGGWAPVDTEEAPGHLRSANHGQGLLRDAPAEAQEPPPLRVFQMWFADRQHLKHHTGEENTESQAPPQVAEPNCGSCGPDSSGSRTVRWRDSHAELGITRMTTVVRPRINLLFLTMGHDPQRLALAATTVLGSEFYDRRRFTDRNAELTEAELSAKAEVPRGLWALQRADAWPGHTSGPRAGGSTWRGARAHERDVPVPRGDAGAGSAAPRAKAPLGTHSPHRQAAPPSAPITFCCSRCICDV